ncbi:hypothetical protein DPMN_192032 [Dreissena polymorpha]|uniref:Uncharacterized protein n=1 Tax=Dreissena polymorpha TaxID=45954 RepID=A0A9D3XZM4_DREPO|nr:hypothetical protein DPMN_192032 [Dreissena polymorpha]
MEDAMNKPNDNILSSDHADQTVSPQEQRHRKTVTRLKRWKTISQCKHDKHYEPTAQRSRLGQVFGDDAMLDLDPSWFQMFKQTVADDTYLGQMLSESERSSIRNSLQNETSIAILSRFLERWNKTASAWQNGTLTKLEETTRVISLSRLKLKIKQYITDNDAASARGYANIFDQFDYASFAYNQALQKEMSEGGSKSEGVCARVRVCILQELVLTRDAFTARLELENGEQSDLHNLKIEIEIRETYGLANNSIDTFSIVNDLSTKKNIKC